MSESLHLSDAFTGHHRLVLTELITGDILLEFYPEDTEPPVAVASISYDALPKVKEWFANKGERDEAD